MKTSFLSKIEAQNSRKWWVVDVANQRVGRVATTIATLLTGKHNPSYTPNQTCGDFVVVVNAAKLQFSGKKAVQKFYYKHSGFPGGLRKDRADRVLASNPEKVLFAAVNGMIPKNTLRKKIMNNLKIFAGSEHDHTVQKPINFDLLQQGSI